MPPQEIDDALHYRLNSFEARLVRIEDTITWLSRLVIGGFIGALVAFAMKGGIMK